MDPLLADTLIGSCFAITALSFCVTLASTINRPWARNQQDSLPGKPAANTYQDQDGEALDTLAPSVLYSIVKLLVLIINAASLGLSVYRLVVHNLEPSTGLITLGWLLTMLMSFYFVLGEKPTVRFTTGSLIAVSSIALSLALVIQIFSNDIPMASRSLAVSVSVLASWLQLGLGLLLAGVSTSIPRRPPVYYKGMTVDGQYTCSPLQRFSFAWTGSLLGKARSGTTLEFTDLPALDNASRSQTLLESFPATVQRYDAKNPLWRAIIIAHWRSFLLQWAMCIFESVVMMLPPICLYQILRLLEDRAQHSVRSSDLWLWIICLGCSKLLHVTLDPWVIWLAFAGVALKVRSQLFALIYAKALRMRIINGGIDYGKTSESAQSDSVLESNQSDKAQATERDPLLPPAKSDQPETTDAIETEKSKDTSDEAARGLVNLLAMDVGRIYTFAAWNIDFVRGIAKLLLAVAFLILLLGWWSTLAGLAIPVVLQPVNQFVTHKYTDGRMKNSVVRDRNTHIITEALHGIRQIKLTATELQWQSQILSSRSKVVDTQWHMYIWAAYLQLAWHAVPVLMGATSLSIYAKLYHEMTPAVAFTTLTVLTSLEWTIGELPMTITEWIDALVSTRRVQELLNAEEHQHHSAQGDQIQFHDVTIAWPSDSIKERFKLSSLELDFPLHGLSVIHGQTGSGKSLLLAAIIGEADVLAGTVSVPEAPPLYPNTIQDIPLADWIVPNARAYVAQVPWIENASVRHSILYGLPYHHGRYAEVLHACALEADILTFPDGENTEIGATGINLSGGQKWRLSLARALYSRASILILDDIFSAVDAHVGRHLLQHAIMGKLGHGRTRILVTHHLGLVKQSADYIVDLDIRKAYPADQTCVDQHSPPHIFTPDAASDQAEQTRSKEPSKTQPKKFVEDETRATGRVGIDVYKAFILASGGFWTWIGAILIFTISAGLIVTRSYWLAVWTKAYTRKPSRSSVKSFDSPDEPDLNLYLGIYLALAFLSIITVGFKNLIILFSTLKASMRLFEGMAYRVLRAKLRWLDTEPTGRVLNRFVGDFTLIDDALGMNTMFTFDATFALLSIAIAALLVSLWMLLPMVLLLAGCLYVMYLYIDGARDLKRLDSLSKSPLFDHVNSSISGLATIRSFGKSSEYLDRMYALIDRTTQTRFYTLLTSQWMRCRQGVLGVLLTISVAILVCSLPNIDGSLAGFTLSFALNFSTVVEHLINSYTSLELEMNCVERAVEYTQLATEPQTGTEPLSPWPSEGKVEFQDLSTGYAPDLPPILKHLTFDIPAGHRIGIVGRTGSGKSSLTLALFRLLEPRSGHIAIDGVDISTLPLATLRSRLAIIPQDPVLFSGTLRSNLDPFSLYDDAALFDVLRRVHLLPSSFSFSHPTHEPEHSIHTASATNSRIFADLSTSIARGGANLSQGQKQLLCLARAILAHPKVLVLDEATSAVDMETDKLIQRSIREDFAGTTLLVVAHRLSTVADFDKILVLEAGRVVEYDEPKILARKVDGVFWAMVQESGEREALESLLVN